MTADDTGWAMLSANELAARLSVSEQALRRWRDEGAGPPWVKLPGGQIRYPLQGVDEWIMERTRGSDEHL